MALGDRQDEELVASLADGDLAALRELYRRHAPWLKARLTRRCADPDLVDDAIQDTFVAVWRSAARFEPRGDVGAWVWGIAIRRLISAIRHHGRRPALAPDPPADVPSAEDLVLLGVQHGDLGTALARLSPELRAVVQSTILDGLTVREAAQLLGVPSGTVKTRLARAKAQLREQLA